MVAHSRRRQIEVIDPLNNRLKLIQKISVITLFYNQNYIQD